LSAKRPSLIIKLEQIRKGRDGRTDEKKRTYKTRGLVIIIVRGIPM